MRLQPIRGTRDILPSESHLFRRIEEVAWRWSERFGFGEIHTPIFESSAVFSRSLGESSDVVNKEMYTFTDRGGDELSLRPEGTASVARAFISNGLQQELPLKLYYAGPMFRYERPQKGRYRQFHQIGVESLGNASPGADSEVIELGYRLLESLQIHKDCQLEINSLGDQESRQAFREALVEYLQPFRKELSEDSQLRLEKNPLRILDSKSEQDKKILEGAPELKNFLNSESRGFFDEVLSQLETLGIPYVESARLVRGLDYYTHCVFEFTTQKLGSQGAVLSGGRYDGLIESMGGPSVPAVGWACGLERLALLCESQEIKISQARAAVIDTESETLEEVRRLASQLRQAGLIAFQIPGNKLAQKLKRANKLGASHAVLLGGEELKQGKFTLKDLQQGSQQLLDKDELIRLLTAYPG